MTKQHYIITAIIALLAGLCIGLSGCSSDLGADLPTLIVKEAKQKMVQYQEVGDIKYFHYFQDKNGQTHQVETTKEDFDKYKNTGSPSYKNMKWLYSNASKDVIKNFPPLNDNEFYQYIDDAGQEKIIIKENGNIIEKDFNYLINEYEKIINVDNSVVDISS